MVLVGTIAFEGITVAVGMMVTPPGVPPVSLTGIKVGVMVLYANSGTVGVGMEVGVLTTGCVGTGVDVGTAFAGRVGEIVLLANKVGLTGGVVGVFVTDAALENELLLEDEPLSG